MAEVWYTVTATFPDERNAGLYIDWLRSGHLQQVLQGGAISGAIVRVDDPPSPIRIQTRYQFPSRGAFDRYVERYAPALRADGVRRFGGDSGIVFQRETGTVLEVRFKDPDGAIPPDRPT
jgi:hypothetical protein